MVSVHVRVGQAVGMIEERQLDWNDFEGQSTLMGWTGRLAEIVRLAELE